MSRFLFQVENCFFHVEIFISSRSFYLMSRVFSCRHFSFQEENFFYLKSRFLFSSRSFKWTFLNSRRDVTQEYLLASPGNDKSNKITWRSVFYVYSYFMFIMFIAVFYAFVLIQFTEGNIEELQSFLLAIQDCINRIEQSTAPENDRTLEYLRDRLKGYIQIVLAISLVLTKVQGFLTVKVLIEHLWQSLREQPHHTRERLAYCRQIRAVFPRSPLQSEGSSGGRPKYHITAEQIDVLRSTGMSWTANAKCLRVSAKTLSRRRQEYGITDYTEIREDELEWNVRDILQLTPFSGETYLQGALRARGIHIQRWKIRDALQQIDPVNRAVRRRYAIRRRIYNVNKTI